VSGSGNDVPVRWEPDPDRPVLRVILDRPAKLNALNDAVRVGLQRAADELAERDDIRVVVLAGAWRSFSIPTCSAGRCATGAGEATPRSGDAALNSPAPRRRAEATPH
jgi:1,4-dihydroxy-2-naphthoyl-CoA synthase